MRQASARGTEQRLRFEEKLALQDHSTYRLVVSSALSLLLKLSLLISAPLPAIPNQPVERCPVRVVIFPATEVWNEVLPGLASGVLTGISIEALPSWIASYGAS